MPLAHQRFCLRERAARPIAFLGERKTPSTHDRDYFAEAGSALGGGVAGRSAGLSV